MALTRAPKKGAKAGKRKSKTAAKKSSVKKSKIKKVKPAKKVVKIAQKAVLDAKDVAAIVRVKDLVIHQKSVLTELHSRGIDNIHRIVKKADQENICTFVSTLISSSLAIFKDTVIKKYILESL